MKVPAPPLCACGQQSCSMLVSMIIRGYMSTGFESNLPLPAMWACFAESLPIGRASSLFACAILLAKELFPGWMVEGRSP